MIVLVQANVLTVGLNGRSESLKKLPIRLIAMHSAAEAISSFKNEKINSVISKWDLDDMRDGQFLKRLKAARPNIPTIAFVAGNDPAQEISARSIGVSAVLTEGVSNEVFQETVANVLGLKGVVAIKSIIPA